MIVVVAVVVLYNATYHHLIISGVFILLLPFGLSPRFRFRFGFGFQASYYSESKNHKGNGVNGTCKQQKAKMREREDREEKGTGNPGIYLHSFTTNYTAIEYRRETKERREDLDTTTCYEYTLDENLPLNDFKLILSLSIRPSYISKAGETPGRKEEKRNQRQGGESVQYYACIEYLCARRRNDRMGSTLLKEARKSKFHVQSCLYLYLSI